MNGPLLQEYRALRHAKAAVDRSARGRIAVTGRDRLAYLHAMLTNDIASLGPGMGCYAAYLTPQGRMMADMTVLELGDLTLLDVEPGFTALVLEKLEQFIFSEDVQVSDLSAELADVCVGGPDAAEALFRVLQPGGPGQAALAAMRPHHSMRASFGGGSAVVAARDEFGVPAFDVYLAGQHAGDFQAALGGAGVVAASGEAADILRVEAGRPRFGVDMDETTIPLEAGIEARAISFTKGCYPGQEVITRVLHRGHGRVARRLVGVRCEGEIVPSRGDAFVAGDKEIGRVTSGISSPALERPIALGYLQRDHVEPGTVVVIVHGDARISATVTALPFVPAR